jgi:methylmalonyl-CoA/ethylmalonyl-CoA epimerase
MIRLHHTGFVVENIDQYEKKMFFERKLKDVVDNVQNARLSLYENFAGSGVYIELIQPLNENAFTMNALKKNGNHFNHFCYSVDSAEEMYEVAGKERLISVLGPVPALLFDNKNVAFYYGRNRQIIEFLINN